MAEYKEVFTLFDKDRNGVLSFTETKLAVRTLGQWYTGGQLVIRIKDLSSHRIYQDKLNMPEHTIIQYILIFSKILLLVYFRQ